jgi:MSHA biogenesis protein MshQ
MILQARILLLAVAALTPFAAHAHSGSVVGNPTGCVNVAVGGNPNWVNPGNALTSNGTVATSAVGDNQATDALHCTGYGFAIPAGATIEGIIIRVERRTSAVPPGTAPTQDFQVRVIKGGVVQAFEGATTTAYTGADVIEPHGSAAELWGTTWTAADINAANFGARFMAFKNGTTGGGVTVSVDHVQIEVFYNSVPPQVTLASPADGATVLTPQPLFSWNAAVDADGDTVTYDLQVDDTDCTFGSPEIDETGLTGTSRTSTTALFEGTHCWRVRAVDQHGIAGAWSATRNVIISAPATLSQTASPGTCVSVPVGGNPNWANPANAQTSNGTVATSTVGDNTATDALVCTQYGFAIPTGATILGIVINVERRTNDVSAISPTRDFSVLAIKNGAAAPSNLATGTDYTLADVVEPHGSATELWGTTWTPADINATNFGASFMAWKAGTVGGNVTISVDHVAITVHYTNPAATPSAFTAFETGTAGGATSGVIQTKVAGVGFGTDVVAILSGAQHSTFTTTALVDLVGNNTLGQPLDAQNCPTAFTVIQSSTPANPVITSGRSTVSFAAVPNSWRDVRVRIRFPASAPTVTACSNDNFAIRPASFTVAASDATWQTAGTARALTNVAASGGMVHAAGRPFTLTLTVSPGTATSYNTDPTATATTTLPAGGANGTLSAGAFSTGSSTRTSTSATYSEAGVFDLTLLDDTFAQVDAGDGTPATCAGRQVCQSGAPLAVGRFVPDHFAVIAGTSPVFRTFDTTDVSCTGARTFTYVGQLFGYQTAPTASVEARNAAGIVTTNYRGTLWKIAAADLVQSFSNPGKTIVPALGAATLTEVANTGTGTLSPNAADKISFQRTGVEVPFTANISLTWSVSDGSELAGDADNGSIATSTPLVFSSTFDGGAGGAEIRFGRLRLVNANGSQLVPLPVRMEAQYYASAALGFVTNADDHCTAIASTDVAMTFTGNLAPAPTNCKTVLSNGGPLTAGRRTLMLSAPGSGNDGAAMLTVNLGAASGNTCTVNTSSPPVGATGAARTHLRGNWTVTTYTEDPSARATFGAFKGAGEVIFIRENF